MSTGTELWKKWEGRIVDGKFPLRQWLGDSDHSTVFLTERSGTESRKAVVKLISPGPDDAAQLSSWAGAAKLSHPHLIRLFECGRCQIDDTRMLYVVMEHAEENLEEVLPLRRLSTDEASDTIRPTAQALAYLHQAGLAHGRIKPSNILAVGNQLRISADGLRNLGEQRSARAHSEYDAPEIVTTGPSAPADIWSLGMTLTAVLTQKEPKRNSAAEGSTVVPDTILQPLAGVLRQCLQVDPGQRCTASDILRQMQPNPSQPRIAGAEEVDEIRSQARPKRWIVVPIIVVALFLIAWLGIRLMVHPSQIPAAQIPSASSPQTAETPAAQSPAPFADKRPPPQSGSVSGSVLRQVLPDVSPSAQRTIRGRLRVSVRVAVDVSGDVSAASLVSPGPSKYFADRALAAARAWKFNPPQVNGQAAASEWTLHFQFRNTSIQVAPVETKP